MRRIYKYPLELSDYPTIELPKGAKILDIAAQRDTVYLWALVDPDEDHVEIRHLRFAGTGHPIRETQLHHLSTFQMRDGDLIFHVFEIM